MSLESWRREYYPIPAHEVSKEDAAKHSLQKWIGLRVEIEFAMMCSFMVVNLQAMILAVWTLTVRLVRCAYIICEKSVTQAKLPVPIVHWLLLLVNRVMHRANHTIDSWGLATWNQ